MLLEQVKNLNIYNLIGVLVVCIIIYVVVSLSVSNPNINIDNINMKFEKNKKLSSISFSKINVNKSIVDISVSKVVDYINKYLEKKYEREYDLSKEKLSNIIMEYNKEYELYKISYTLDLKVLVLEITLYLDKNREVYISSITKKIDNQDLELDIDIDIDNNLDLLDLFKDTNKLFDLTNKIRDMTNNGYSLVIEDPNNKQKQNMDNTNNTNNTNNPNNTNNTNNIVGGENNKNSIQLYQEEKNVVNNDTFLNGDNMCEGCHSNSPVITCDIKKDLYSQYALF